MCRFHFLFAFNEHLFKLNHVVVVTDELCMCRVLENQITYDGKQVPSRDLCPCRGTALTHPQELKIRDYL